MLSVCLVSRRNKTARNERSRESVIQLHCCWDTRDCGGLTSLCVGQEANSSHHASPRHPFLGTSSSSPYFQLVVGGGPAPGCVWQSILYRICVAPIRASSIVARGKERRGAGASFAVRHPPRLTVPLAAGARKSGGGCYITSPTAVLYFEVFVRERSMIGLPLQSILSSLKDNMRTSVLLCFENIDEFTTQK